MEKEFYKQIENKMNIKMETIIVFRNDIKSIEQVMLELRNRTHLKQFQKYV